MEYFLHADRIAFRPWTRDDMGLATRLWSDAEVTRYIGGPFTPDQIRNRLEKELQNQDRYGIQYWPVFLSEDDTFIGCCGLRPYGERADIRELGFHLCRDRWGKGYATEAAACVITHAFEVLHLQALFAGHHPRNTDSAKVLAKLGFTYVRDEFYPPTGLNHPSYELRREAHHVQGALRHGSCQAGQKNF